VVDKEAWLGVVALTVIGRRRPRASGRAVVRTSWSGAASARSAHVTTIAARRLERLDASDFADGVAIDEDQGSPALNAARGRAPAGYPRTASDACYPFDKLKLRACQAFCRSPLTYRARLSGGRFPAGFH